MILGITGGTGCGKTTLLDLIGAAGGIILDCDAIYHEMLSSDLELLAAIEARFPGTVEGNQLQRKKLGSIVFADPQALLDLNAITHSAIRQELRRRLAHGPALAAIDAIALHDAHLDELCDVTVAVTAPLEDRVCRLMRRDDISEEYARKRITAQHDASWFMARCDYVLHNDSDMESFRQQCLSFLQKLGILGKESYLK